MAEVKPDHKVEDGASYAMGNNVDPKNVQELTQYVQTLLQNMQDKFQTIIDDLEKNIGDLMTQAGVEGAEK
ncbi:hypothetical protein TSAR_007294 [Trichomalopsis sarcophagae]|uniref:Heat shock factor binding protein 1 n=1 Tax=Trichomalopsis sarcophagae TaxID=543379 RepID=A0A232F906_9HYME|nr:hypothetical protein TSAR_007294 [Trichomalopsis sarcophagae]